MEFPSTRFGEKLILSYLSDLSDLSAIQLLPYVKPPALKEQEISFYLNGNLLGSKIYTAIEINSLGIEVQLHGLKPPL